MKHPLIVIDVQLEFIRHMRGKKRLLAQVIKTVRKARKENRHVFLVQYTGSGPTHRSIRKSLANYDKVHVVIKRYDNGGPEIYDALYTQGISGKTLTVCGVNLSACVARTVNDLVYRGYKCRLVKEATVNSWEKYTPLSRKYFAQTVEGTYGYLEESVQVTSVCYA